ncbi:MAG: PEP-CTERM sorting domain-containing protein [Thermodesulfobacteriota bacterium]
MKRIVLGVAVITMLMFSVGARTVQATSMLPNLDYFGLSIPDGCNVCDMTVTGITYNDGTTAPALADSVLGATVRFDYNNSLDDTDDTFSIFSGAGTFLTADIDWTKGTTTVSGPTEIINPTFAHNLYNVSVNTSLGSRWADELAPEVADGFAATMLVVVDNGIGTSNVMGKVVPTPEPGTLLLLGSGLVGLGLAGRKRKGRV